MSVSLRVEEAGLGAADRLQALRAGRARLRDDVEAAVAPVRGHLAPAGRGVVGRADRLQEHLVRRDAERQAQRAVAVVGKTQSTPGRRCMPAAARIASWPAPLIWKKIWLWFLSWISLSSSFRDRQHDPERAEQVVAGEARLAGLREHVAGDSSVLDGGLHRRSSTPGSAGCGVRKRPIIACGRMPVRS